MPRILPLLLLSLLTFAAVELAAQAGPRAAGASPQLAIEAATATVDGDLGEWKSIGDIRFGRDQIFDGATRWQGGKDASGEFSVTWDNNRLYLAGLVRDDERTSTELAGQDRFDCLELHIGAVEPGDEAANAAAAAAAAAGERSVLRLFPLQAHRRWAWWSGDRATSEEPLQPVTQLAGIQVAALPGDGGGFAFEAAIPFHHFPNLRPGARVLGFDLVLRDYDVVGGGGATRMSWSGRDPFEGPLAGRLLLDAPGLLAPDDGGGESLLSGELFVDLPYLLVPLLALALLVLLLRVWGRMRDRLPWIRPALVFVGIAAFLVGLWLPSLMTGWRAEEQRAELDGKLVKVQEALGRLEVGSLASYRGASRDGAVIDLVSGRSIQRQRYTTYRPLVDVVPDQFGPPLRSFDDLPVRSYWLPLPEERPASFQFDPPLQGTWLYLVMARPYLPALPLTGDPTAEPATLDLELDHVGEDKQSRTIVLDLPFADASPLGREYWEACVLKLELDGELRSVAVGCSGDPELRLVGISLEGTEPGSIRPVSLGEPSRAGVLTDLRGPYPQDAGVELGAGAAAKVTIPEQEESPERLWLFYRAVYPGLPTANPGARVAEVLLHFADGRQARSIVLEHQVSMFYELAVHNTRDDPPVDSPASIALTWVDESQERHLNLGYPVLDLPTDTALSAIEFRNLSDYRVRFRSVVFENEKAVAPQDPPDSPLLREGIERRLSSDALAELQDVVLSIYRNGQLSESTLGSSDRQEVLALPRAVGAAESTETADLLPGGRRRLSVFAPLRGDGWDGAVLAISSTDQEWAAAEQDHSRVGLLLCLLSTPFLLLLLSDLLAVVANLRFRLMTVMSVASLVPLGVLSLVLVQVLESGHASEVEDGVRATVNSAMTQLEDQKNGVKASARQWLRDLATMVERRLDAGDGEAPSVGAIKEELQKLLLGQLPPEWRGGFLRLEWQLDSGAADPVVLVAGDERFVRVEAPARLDPGLFMQWGQLMLGVRAEQQAGDDTFTLTAGRPLDGSLLGALAPGSDLLLTDVRGYPIAASDSFEQAADLRRQASNPPTMAERERSLATAEETRRAVVLRESTPSGDYVVGTSVLRDLQETPRGLLVVAQPDERATLDLAIGRIPVRAFFLLVAGSLIVLAVFLSFVVSGRISRPIEKLEAGAQALARGSFDARVSDDEGGQVGRLTRTFNQMAEDLQGRLQDLQALNRTMADLAAEHDEARAIEVLRRFCATHTGADAVVTTMLSDDGGALLLRAAGEESAQRVDLHGWPIVAVQGPFSCRAIAGGGGDLPRPWREALPQSRSLLGLPIVFAGQARGVVLLGFDLAEPTNVDLDLLTTVVAQAAGACERSQLQRFALMDPVTGVCSPDYFHRRVVDEVARSQFEQRSLALLGFQLQERNRSPERLQGFARLLRDRLPAEATLGRGEGSGTFYAVLPGSDGPEAERVRQELGNDWRAMARHGGFDVDERTFRSSLALCPEQAASSEFLFEAVRARLRTDPDREAVEAESDRSLLRVGVTAVSPAMRPVYSALRRVAPTDLPVLLEGETGVGKEVLTDLIHRWSRRSAGPLVKVHCASLSETLLASELFGHERGAFTGADRRKIGRFEQAHEGTLFLDEVGEIPLEVQVALLRALQEGQIDRVGGSQSVRVDVRVLAATNRDMKQMVADGRFREDLYYRLQGMVVVVPPLRERREELPKLVERFRGEIVASTHAANRVLSTDALDALYRQDWPGNVRQLRTVVHRAMVLAQGELVYEHDVEAALVDRPSLSAGVRGFDAPARSAAGGSAVAASSSARVVARDGEVARAASPSAGDSVVPDPESAIPAFVLPRAQPLELGAAQSTSRDAKVRPSENAESLRDSPPGEQGGPDADWPPVEIPKRAPLAERDSGSSPDPSAGGAAGRSPAEQEFHVSDRPVLSDPQRLPPRLQRLLARILAAERYTTREHMAECGVSHRTALRDLQILVENGFVERVGVRRGAFYRPCAGGQKADDQ
ncbi:MAG: sigma 54-interacting transcriptional regulator [Planctomycetota bacterium]